jgi:trafficking protein particle complex subunit 9
MLNPDQSGGSRSGDLSLRQQRFSMLMLNALQVKDIRVQLSMRTYGRSKEADMIDYTGGSYFPPANEFVYLYTKVTNLSCKHNSRALHAPPLMID